MTTIIITETHSPYGKYWAYRIKGEPDIIVEVDRTKKDSGFVGYKIFGGKPMRELGRRWKRSYAFEFAKRAVIELYPDAVFKMNAVTEWRRSK